MTKKEQKYRGNDDSYDTFLYRVLKYNRTYFDMGKVESGEQNYCQW